VPENNAVGTHEFFDLVEQLGAEAYVNGNLGTGTPQEAAEWLEYMTGGGSSTLAQLRRKNGRDKPFRALLRARQRELGLRRQYAERLPPTCTATGPPSSRRRSTTAPSSSPAAA
jgi:hypothetical protein